MKNQTVFTLASLGVVIFFLHSSFQSPEKALCDAPLLGPAHSGAPGEVNCTGCHSGTINSGTGILTVDLGVPDSTYTPGQTYSATITLFEAGIDKFGFQVCLLEDSNNTSTGILILTDVNKTRLIPDVSREYVGNTPCGADADSIGYNTWTFDWQAPGTNKGMITAYISGLGTNHSHSTAGDETYTQTIQLTPTMPLGINMTREEESDIEIFPNPADGEIKITSQVYGKKITAVTLYSVSGQVTRRYANLRSSGMSIDVSNLPTGLYLIQIGDVFKKKIMIQH
ncbi:MAG: hypothetical protein COB85_01650 [Bacteroidetes bacterium]|nr:MAG: hypothetical protein COB85_01650 [Bacteroidota bacterium]